MCTIRSPAAGSDGQRGLDSLAAYGSTFGGASMEDAVLWTGPPVETQPGIALVHEEFASNIHASAVERASVAPAPACSDAALTRTAALRSDP
jgi:hypothetical protein